MSTPHLFRQFTYGSEKEFEEDVVMLAEQIFGPSTIYVNVKKRVRGADIVTIPDGYLIDMTEADEPKLYVIENEIVSHDPFRHIGIQMLKFVTSFDDGKIAVRNFLMDEIAKNPEALAKLKEGCDQSNSRNIDNYLDVAVYGDFRGIVVIDEARPELHRVLEKIYANISVFELKTFVSDRGERLHMFDTLYDEFDENLPQTARHAGSRKTVSAETRAARRKECQNNNL